VKPRFKNETIEHEARVAMRKATRKMTIGRKGIRVLFAVYCGLHTSMPIRRNLCADTVILRGGERGYDSSDSEWLVALIRRGETDVGYGSRFALLEWTRNALAYSWGIGLLTWVTNAFTGFRLTDEATSGVTISRRLGEITRLSPSGALVFIEEHRYDQRRLVLDALGL